MSTVNWNSIFKLPKSALQDDRTIHKTKLNKAGNLTSADKKSLKKMNSLRLFATVQESSTRIFASVDEERDIRCIIFLRCEMQDSEAYAEVARVLHKCFPNPTVILFEGSDQLCISVSITRKNLAEAGTTVIETVTSTGPFCIEDQSRKRFFDSLAFSELPQDNLYVFLEAIAWRVKLSQAIEAVGFFPVCPTCKRATMTSLLDKQGSLSSQIRSISRQQSARDLTLNESSKLRIDKKRLQKQLDTTVEAIKELCND